MIKLVITAAIPAGSYFMGGISDQWFSDDFKGNKQLICLNLLNIRNEIWWQSLTDHSCKWKWLVLYLTVQICRISCFVFKKRPNSALYCRNLN